MNSGPALPGVDISEAHPARRYNYWLGGKDNFAADRASGDAIAAVFPHIRTAARENRAFLGRLVRYLVTDCGIRQFLDIGTGLPTADNTHEVAQAIAAVSRIVYVDNDPIVLVHARALLTSDPAGRTAYLDADLNHPEHIVNSDVLTGTLDLSKPVAVLLVAVLHFVDGDAHARSIIEQLTAPLVTGSYIGLSHATSDLLAPDVAAQLHAIPGSGFVDRTRGQIAKLLAGYDVQEPGIQVVTRWRPDPDTVSPPDDEVSVYGALARVGVRRADGAEATP